MGSAQGGPVDPLLPRTRPPQVRVDPGQSCGTALRGAWPRGGGLSLGSVSRPAANPLRKSPPWRAPRPPRRGVAFSLGPRPETFRIPKRYATPPHMPVRSGEDMSTHLENSTKRDPLLFVFATPTRAFCAVQSLICMMLSFFDATQFRLLACGLTVLPQNSSFLLETNRLAFLRHVIVFFGWGCASHPAFVTRQLGSCAVVCTPNLGNCGHVQCQHSIGRPCTPSTVDPFLQHCEGQTGGGRQHLGA